MESHELVIPKELNELNKNKLPTLAQIKAWYIEFVLDVNDGNKSQSARHLGIAIRTLRNWDNRTRYSERKGGKYIVSRKKLIAHSKRVSHSNLKEEFEFRCHQCNKLIMKERRRKNEIPSLRERKFSCSLEHTYNSFVAIH